LKKRSRKGTGAGGARNLPGRGNSAATRTARKRIRRTNGQLKEGTGANGRTGLGIRKKGGKGEEDGQGEAEGD
jgi:hypothetical protein